MPSKTFFIIELEHCIQNLEIYICPEQRPNFLVHDVRARFLHAAPKGLTNTTCKCSLVPPSTDNIGSTGAVESCRRDDRERFLTMDSRVTDTSDAMNYGKTMADQGKGCTMKIEVLLSANAVLIQKASHTASSSRQQRLQHRQSTSSQSAASVSHSNPPQKIWSTEPVNEFP
jgi:hypothetical protein